MNKLPTPNGALCTIVLLMASINLWAQLTPQVFIQNDNPLSKAIVIEAENASSITDKTTGDTRNWVETMDVAASGGKALLASGGTDDGLAGQQAISLQEAKAYFYFQFKQEDTYYLYVRYKAASAGADEMYLADDFNTPIRSILTGATADGTYHWQLASDLSGMPTSDGYFPGSYVVTVDDVNQVATLVFFPREAGFYLDKIVLSEDNTLTDVDLDLLTTETSLGYPDLPDNVLKYTAFEGFSDELEINLAASSYISVVDYPGHDNYHYSFLGNMVGVLDKQATINSPVMQFQPVDITCNYTDLNICFRWMAPQALEDAFVNLSDQLQVVVSYIGGTSGGGGEIPIDPPISGNAMNTTGDNYNLTCVPLSPPLDATGLVIRLVLTANDVTKDVFIGTAYLTVTNGTIPTASLMPGDVDASADPMVSFDGSNSIDATLYEWNFGDGTTAAASMMATTTHEYTSNGTFKACLSVLDACENLPDVACQQVTISSVLPVELLYFSAEQKVQNIHLSWATATELNNDYFSIEYSRDGRIFSEIAQQKGLGSTYEQQNYQFEHLNPGAGRHYYRLRQVDFDGQYEYSRTVSVDLDAVERLDFFPNPVENTLTIAGPEEEVLSLEIYQIDGRRVENLLTASNHANDLSHLGAGIYYLKIKDLNGALLSYQRFIKL